MRLKQKPDSCNLICKTIKIFLTNKYKMKTTQNTVLITGGSAGIGFEMARQLSEKGNHVIILGRNKERLQQAAAKLQNVTAIMCDITNENDVNNLTERIKKDFPGLNVLINNAGNASVYRLSENIQAYEKAADEMQTNYLSVIRLTEKLLPILSGQSEAAVVNVSSIVVFVPVKYIPTYSASKAALHSYTQSLRVALAENTPVKVFELMPPLVDTEFSKEIGGANGIAPSVVASDLVQALENDNYEIHVGGTAGIYELFRADPKAALEAMNNR
jgi:uncharacterized oxidoreductase